MAHFEEPIHWETVHWVAGRRVKAIIRDATTGVIVAEPELTDRGDGVLTWPAELPLKPGVTYTWTVKKLRSGPGWGRLT